MLCLRHSRLLCVHPVKTTSKRVVQKIAEAPGDLIGNKITNILVGITLVGKTKSKEGEVNKDKKCLCCQRKDNKLLMT